MRWLLAVLLMTAVVGLAGYRPGSEITIAGLEPGMSLEEVRLLRGRPELSYQSLEGELCWRFSDGVEVGFVRERVARVTGFPLLEDGCPVQPEEAGFSIQEGVVESAPSRSLECVTYERGAIRLQARVQAGQVEYTLPGPQT